jgi:hypothetical protein
VPPLGPPDSDAPAVAAPAAPERPPCPAPPVVPAPPDPLGFDPPHEQTSKTTPSTSNERLRTDNVQALGESASLSNVVLALRTA